MRYLAHTSLLAVAILTSNPVMANELLDRLEVASELIAKKQGEFYLTRVPELEGKLPSWDWDDEIRVASKCVLDGIAESKGDDIARAYVEGIEKDAQMEFTSLTQLSDNTSIPDELKGNDSTIINLMQSCNTMQISAQRLKDSGMWDLMLDPSVMQRLAADQ